MKDVLNLILSGFHDSPKKAAWDVLFVVLVCAAMIAFVYWYAVPIPEVLP